MSFFVLTNPVIECLNINIIDLMKINEESRIYVANCFHILEQYNDEESMHHLNIEKL
jgi:hypothetical protein